MDLTVTRVHTLPSLLSHCQCIVWTRQIANNQRSVTFGLNIEGTCQT